MNRTAPLMLAMAAACAADPAIHPVDPAECLIAADAPAVIRLAAAPGRQLAWTLSGWDGAAEASGTAVADQSGVAGIAVAVPAGWHALGVEGREFGIVAQDPAWSAAPDPFFAIDAAMSWLVKEDVRREALIGQMRRLGFGQVRERLAWWALQPGPGRFHAETAFRDDGLRALYARNRIEVLDAFHDAPQWLGRVSGSYPADMADVAASWGTIAARFPATTAIEVWNEPDAAEFAGDGTADQLATLSRAVAWAVRSARPDVQVAVGVLTRHATPAYRASCFANGLLAAGDAFTYHDYADPDQFETFHAGIRGELAAAGDPSIPIWITESGKAWPKGPDRPGAEADILSAQWIAVRAAEARACGVARYYAFVYPFYPEGRNNFSMTGRDGTALRSLAAYSHLARRLAGLDYAGDLAIDGAKRCRLFAGGGRAVAVAWFGAPGTGRRLVTGLPVRACLGLDGRRIAASDGGWSISDGACILDLDPAAIPRADAGTPAMRLWQAAHAARLRPEPSPMVMQIIPSPGDVGSRLDHYALVPQPGGAANTLRVRVTGFAPGEATARLRLLPPAGSSVVDGDRREVRVFAPGWIEVSWRIIAAAPGTWRVEGAADGRPLTPIVVPIVREVDGEALLARLPAGARRRITATELLGVDRNIGAGNRMTPEALPDGTFRLSVEFPNPDHWVFPRLSLPADARFGRYDAVIAKVRSRDPAAVRMFAFRAAVGSADNIGYISKDPIIAADGSWHWALVRLADLEASSSTQADPDGRLDPAHIDRISIGFNSQGKSNVLEIARLELVDLASLGAQP